ncbi:hypothetical protein V8E52_011254 [Russula decolorans]
MDTPSGTNDAEANDSTSTYDYPAIDLDDADVTDTNTFQELTREEGAEKTIEIESNSMKTSSVVVDIFPFGNPGAPIPGVPQGRSSYAHFRATQGDTVWAPFRSQRDWDIARWAKTHSISSTAVSELLAIPEVPDILGLSYHIVKQLNEFIDHELSGCPSFHRKELVIGKERLEFYYRDALESIRSLFGDPQYAQDLMYTCDWWWTIQETLEMCQPGATIIPVILSSDKTQLTVFRDNTAYPIYLTIGNISKNIRRKPSRMAQILIGFIPTSKLHGLSNQSARRRALANLFHALTSGSISPGVLSNKEGCLAVQGDESKWEWSAHADSTENEPEGLFKE